jgi:ferredoxin--NADP+ reductase/benzoate/toluate 1,2-dioxygenase reductase subunit
VAPCRAYLRTHPGLDLTLIHGVRRAEDLFYRDEFKARPYHPCVSGEGGTGFHGRVTDFCASQTFPADAHYYLCGANEMFYDMRDVLARRNIRSDCIFTEAYYYRSDD